MREPSSLVLSAPDVLAMRAIGALLAMALHTAESAFVITLQGELGAGKTTLVGALLNAMGFVGSAKSPTYTLIEPYVVGGRDVYHLDLYRLADPQEVEALAIRDLLVPRSLFLIEWPERGEGVLPSPDLQIRIRYGIDDGREVEISAATNAGRDVLLALTAAAKS